MKEEKIQRFKEFMVKQKLENKDLAHDLNCTTQKITDIKTGKQNITPEFALELEALYQVNPCWLIFGKGNFTTQASQIYEQQREIVIKIQIN